MTELEWNGKFHYATLRKAISHLVEREEWRGKYYRYIDLVDALNILCDYNSENNNMKKVDVAMITEAFNLKNNGADNGDDAEVEDKLAFPINILTGQDNEYTFHLYRRKQLVNNMETKRVYKVGCTKSGDEEPKDIEDRKKGGGGWSPPQDVTADTLLWDGMKSQLQKFLVDRKRAADRNKVRNNSKKRGLQKNKARLSTPPPDTASNSVSEDDGSLTGVAANVSSVQSDILRSQILDENNNIKDDVIKIIIEALETRAATSGNNELTESEIRLTGALLKVAFGCYDDGNSVETPGGQLPRGAGALANWHLHHQHRAAYHSRYLLGINRLPPRHADRICHIFLESDSPSATTESGNEMCLSSDESAEVFNTDELVAIIFSFLPRTEIMRLRRVCTTWRDAVKKTLVPLTKFVVNSVRKYNAMRVLSTTLPNLQQLTICHLGRGHKYSDGEDPVPVEGRARRADGWISHDIDIVSHFRKLHSLKIRDAPLNGRYPVLFDFPLLQILSISECSNLKWDLEMLEGLPLLKELDCSYNPHLTGHISSLIVLKDTLEKVEIISCHRVGGNFMDLADFPHLKELNLRRTAVTGDIRDIREHDFPALEYLFLPKTVRGGIGYEFQNVDDVPRVMHAIHLLLQRTSTLFGESDYLSSFFNWTLSRDSPYWYERERGSESPPPPFRLQFVQAGSRRGWSWYTWTGPSLFSCGINWLDPEPSSECSDYEDYIEELQLIERHINFYRGYHEPPTEEEYRRLCDGLLP